MATHKAPCVPNHCHPEVQSGGHQWGLELPSQTEVAQGTCHALVEVACKNKNIPAHFVVFQMLRLRNLLKQKHSSALHGLPSVVQSAREHIASFVCKPPAPHDKTALVFQHHCIDLHLSEHEGSKDCMICQQDFMLIVRRQRRWPSKEL